MSLPEVLLWQRLRGRGDRPSFRRQHPIGPYVVDIYCAASRLVVEIDGEVHADATRNAFDHRRNQFMQENGYQVPRLTAADVLKDVDAAANAIVSLAALPLHHQPAATGAHACPASRDDLPPADHLGALRLPLRAGEDLQ